MTEPKKRAPRNKAGHDKPEAPLQEAPPVSPEARETLDMALEVAGLLDEKQANNILILDISSLTPMADFFIIADTETQIQLNALRMYIEEMLAARRITPRNARAAQTSWILLDYNGFVVHLFLREAREFYGLERIWRDAKPITPGALPANRQEQG